MSNNTMTVSEAVEQISLATNVQQWNSIRDSIKDAVGDESWISDGFLSAIDSSGLITEILGKQ